MQQLIHRKERIIFTAIDVINTLGVQSLSTKQIAALEGISESTVFKHFGSKNSILKGVLDYYAKFDHDIIDSIQLKKLSSVEGILFFVEAYTTYYENYPAITAITQGLDEMRYISELTEEVDAIKKKRSDCILSLVMNMQNRQAEESGYPAELIVDILLGTMSGIINRWRAENYGFPLKSHSLLATQAIIKGVLE